MNRSYLRLAVEGKNDWWRYALGMLFIIFFWGYVGVLAAILILKIAFLFGIIEPNYPYAKFLAFSIRHVFSSLGVFLVLKYLHQRKFSTLFGIDRRLSLKRLAIGTTVTFSILFVPFLIGGLFDLTLISDVFRLRAWSWLPFIIFSIIVQSAGEEFIYRGYLLQGFSLLNRRATLAVLLSSLAFAHVHFLPSIFISIEEINRFLFCFVFGVVCAAITIRDNRIELAIGVHAGWNIFQTLISGIYNS